jgi:excisionase family DNA binding protein
MTAETVSPAEPEPAGLLLSVDEAAERLRLGRTFVYRLIMSGELESVKVGRLRRVPSECLPEYVAALRGLEEGRRQCRLTKNSRGLCAPRSRSVSRSTAEDQVSTPICWPRSSTCEWFWGRHRAGPEPLISLWVLAA